MLSLSSEEKQNINLISKYSLEIIHKKMIYLSKKVKKFDKTEDYKKGYLIALYDVLELLKNL